VAYGLGIDLGTSFTSVAVHEPGGTRMVPLSREVVIPSVAYAGPDGALLTGLAAEDAARGGETGRVARGFKRRIGDPTPLLLGGAAYSPDALMAAQLRDVLAHVASTEGGPPDTVVLTCPAIWGPYRHEHFAEVPRLAGVPASHLLTEPEAVATHYSAERRLGDGEVVAVYDLGGGTFDTTILRMRSGEMEILGTPEGIEHMGGMDFDETLLAHVDERLDGAVSALDRSDPREAAALAEIRTMCVRAKEELSTEPDVTLSVPLPSGPREVTVTRLEFNDMIRPSIRLTTDALRRTIASASLRTEDLSGVLLAGGSSRIPLVDQMVSEEFGRPVRTTLHPKYTVALGAAAVSTRLPATRTPAAPPAKPAKPAPIPVSAPRRRWPVPAAAVAILAVVVTTLVLAVSGNPRTGDSQPPAAGKTTTVPPTMQVFTDGKAVTPYRTFIASQQTWTGLNFGPEGADQGTIRAVADGPDGLRLTWTGGAWGQFYLQNPTSFADKRSYVDSAGGLVFDTVVHQPPSSLVTLAVHCVYPCVAEVEATELFRGLTPGQRTTVTIPLSCFTAKGLDPKRVNTPFLVYTTGSLDVTFADIRWAPDVAADPDAMRCADLK
jgi:actin-like ATPase involved in cell morphogenesis